MNKEIPEFAPESMPYTYEEWQELPWHRTAAHYTLHCPIEYVSKMDLEDSIHHCAHSMVPNWNDLSEKEHQELIECVRRAAYDTEKDLDYTRWLNDVLEDTFKDWPEGEKFKKWAEEDEKKRRNDK